MGRRVRVAMDHDLSTVAALADRLLDLTGASLTEDYYYHSLSLCVINAVFSIGVRYTAVQNVVERYCGHFSLRRVRDYPGDLPPRDQQESLSQLCEKYETLGVDRFVADIYQNRQRTSPRNGILKAEAVRRVAETLAAHSVEHLQDIPRAMKNPALESAVRLIPGQRSGISLRYLWMLGGSDHNVKPDRMVLRFVRRALQRDTGVDEAETLLIGAADELSHRYPDITPRLLDYKVWQHESGDGDRY